MPDNINPLESGPEEEEAVLIRELDPLHPQREGRTVGGLQLSTTGRLPESEDGVLKSEDGVPGQGFLPESFGERRD